MTTSAKPRIAAVQLAREDTGQCGRAFLELDLLAKAKVADLDVEFNRRFVEEDDKERLHLLECAVKQRAITAVTYPGIETPHELHAYIWAPEVSTAPIFACVLAAMDVVRLLIAMPPHVVFETSTFQVLPDSTSPASVTAGLETWVRRVWPSIRVPRVGLMDWRQDQLVPQDLLDVGVGPVVPLSDAPMQGAREHLAMGDYPRPGELH